MARPPKNPALRHTEHIKVPLMPDQKRLIADAAALDSSDVAGWVRPILLDAAKKRIQREQSQKK